MTNSSLYALCSQPIKHLFTKIDKLTPQTKARDFQFENLEERCVLSANGLDFSQPPTQEVTAVTATESTPDERTTNVENVQTEITSVSLSINGKLTTLDPSGDRLELTVGDKVEVLDVAFDSNANRGVFAVEGYINKIQDQSSASLIDYDDGRFSEIEGNFRANGGGGSVTGLDGFWTADSGWDRLTLSLVHYEESGTTIASRAVIQLEIGRADFTFSTSALESLQKQPAFVGAQFDIHGAWYNQGSGNYHNYAEVDVYHLSNMEEIVWAGALVGNASSEQHVEGDFLNTRNDDPFTETFVPKETGSYLLRFYLDPEGVVSEANESNNQFDVEIFVSEPNSIPVANDDVVETNVNATLEDIDVLANDLDVDHGDLAIETFTEPENGKVTLNGDGTFSYTPDSDFSGTDSFRYTVSDGVNESNAASVLINVSQESFSVEPNAGGDEDTNIELRIHADPEQFTHVRISNVPDEVELSHGQQIGKDSFVVFVEDLAELTVTPAANSDSDLELAITPFRESTAYVDLTETIHVSVNAVADGGQIDVANFGIVAGSSGRLPFQFSFADLDESEQHSLTFDKLPDFISLSAGEKVGDSWVLDYRDLATLSIESTTVDNLTDFQRARGYHYKRFDASVTVESTEKSNGDSKHLTEDFYFYVFQRGQ